jgi:diacylglycerol kinase family enzyme
VSDSQDISNDSDRARYRVMRTPRRFAVMLNARAKRWTGSVHEAVQRYVPARDLFLTDDFRQARRTVDKLLSSGEYDVIFTGGGDGTIIYLVNEVERRIREGELTREDAPPVGVLRLGTGNAIANYLGSRDIMEDLRLVRSGVPLEVHSVNMLEGAEGLFPFAGVGWDADILNDYDILKDAVRDTALENHATGLKGYGAAIATRTIPRAISQKPVQLRIINLGEEALRINYEGEILERFEPDDLMYEGPARICGASSIPYWGFQVRMFPHADTYANFFQLRCYFGGVGPIVANLQGFWNGKIREDLMFDVLASSARVEIDGEPLPYQISGDAAGVERVIEWKLAPHPAQLAVPMR